MAAHPPPPKGESVMNSSARTIGVILNGVTGRMGRNQHLARSILAIRDEGGVMLPDGSRVVPDPVLVGRHAGRLNELAVQHGLKRWSTDLDACLADPTNEIYFDAQATAVRAASVKRAIAAGKHIYCEKPTADSLDAALDLARLANAAGVKNGVVQDKLFLPGLIEMKHLLDAGFFGRVLSARIDFGYWVFEGVTEPAQRPSWNYRKEDGGGIVRDMFAHWRYVIDRLFGPVRAVSCIGATHVPRRVDEQGRAYDCTAEDSAYAMFECEDGIIVQANSSWVVRVDRDDLLTIHVDGTHGSAVAGLRGCKVQHRVTTPRATWNPDVSSSIDYRGHWTQVPAARGYDNAFKVQWERFLCHVAADEPFPWSLLEGAKGTQLAELGLQSWAERRWVVVPPLSI